MGGGKVCVHGTRGVGIALLPAHENGVKPLAVAARLSAHVREEAALLLLNLPCLWGEPCQAETRHDKLQPVLTVTLFEQSAFSKQRVVYELFSLH